MTNRFGNDILLSDGDIVVSPTGDLLTTEDYEKLNPEDARFEGYFSILYSIVSKLLTQKGDNVFEPEYGSVLSDLLSTPNSPNLKTQIRTAIQQALQEDDRVLSVNYVNVDQRDRYVFVKAGVILIGEDSVSELVFPNFVIE